MQRRRKPIVYSCSGCSSAAQMTNALALRLDRDGIARMSCIAGVGGDVDGLVRTAKSGAPVVVLDGCPLVCARRCLSRHAVPVHLHLELSEQGVKKRNHEDFDPNQADRIYRDLAERVGELARWAGQRP
ncbi:putative zinc-binding protein [Ectothiorhodospiraceae bacterium WFHF3C12]|nr:putative zinc-binding protein [Ectothiorhodospiraceae bacterium WFHF3C12]